MKAAQVFWVTALVAGLGALPASGQTYPDTAIPSTSDADALDGTTHDETGVPYIAKGTNESSSPTLNQQMNRQLWRTLQLLGVASQGKVDQETTALKIGVRPMYYRIGSTRYSYTGATGQSVTDDDTSYVYLASDGLHVVTDATGWPAAAADYIMLAEVVAAGGQISSVKDLRWCNLNLVTSYSSLAELTLSGANGLDVNPGSDTDADLVTVGVTGAPKVWWDESEDCFTFSQGGVFAAELFVNTTDGIDVVPGSDTDTDVVTIAVTGSPKAWWDESEDRLAVTHGVTVNDSDGVMVNPGSDTDTTVVTVQVTGTPTTSWDESEDCFDCSHDFNLASGKQYKINDSALIVPYTPSAFLEGTLSVKVWEIEYVAAVDFTLKNVTGRVNTAPTGANLICDVRDNGASIFLNQTEMVNIAAAAYSDTSATKDHALSAGDILTFEVEQIGSGAAGADLMLVLNGRCALQE